MICWGCWVRELIFTENVPAENADLNARRFSQNKKISVYRRGFNLLTSATVRGCGKINIERKSQTALYFVVLPRHDCFSLYVNL